MIKLRQSNCNATLGSSNTRQWLKHYTKIKMKQKNKNENIKQTRAWTWKQQVLVHSRCLLGTAMSSQHGYCTNERKTSTILSKNVSSYSSTLTGKLHRSLVVWSTSLSTRYQLNYSNLNQVSLYFQNSHEAPLQFVLSLSDIGIIILIKRLWTHPAWKWGQTNYLSISTHHKPNTNKKKHKQSIQESSSFHTSCTVL